MSKVWTEPRHWPELADGQVQVWLAHLTGASINLDRYAAVLSPDECARADRFRLPVVREQWRITRGILRMLLARHGGVTARELAFDYNAQGKPRLCLPRDPGLHFNLSHSGDYAAFVLTRVGPVGVDIEQVREQMPQAAEIAQRYFAPSESAQLEALAEPARTRAFFALWTRKEAFVKARGDGLFSGLDGFEVTLGDSPVVTEQGSPVPDWFMSELPPEPGLSGAVVTNANCCTPVFCRWRETFCS